MSQVRSGNMWCPMRGGWIFFALYVDYVHDLQFKNSIQWKLAYHIPKYLPLSDYNCLYSVLIDWITNNLSCPRKKSVLLRQYCYGVYSGNYGSFLAPLTRWKHCDEKAGNSNRWGTHGIRVIVFMTIIWIYCQSLCLFMVSAVTYLTHCQKIPPTHCFMQSITRIYLMNSHSCEWQ